MFLSTEAYRWCNQNGNGLLQVVKTWLKSVQLQFNNVQIYQYSIIQFNSALMLLQTCRNYFLLCNLEDISKNVSMKISRVQSNIKPH